MLSYQHAYHAGNFADVVKHITLSLICDYVTQKDKPLFYLETHSGRGKYDLSLPMANKTAEFKNGVLPLWNNRDTLPEPFQPWLKVIKQYNDKSLKIYPGSPLFALSSLREKDRIHFCELHPKEFEHLRALGRNYKKTRYFLEDGIRHMNASTPPLEKRGIIFIDPSFELKKEYQSIPDAIEQSYKKFSNGIYCLWYPILKNRAHTALLNKLSPTAYADQLKVEFMLSDQSNGGMIGCGMLILNPPYILKAQMEKVCQVLKRYF